MILALLAIFAAIAPPSSYEATRAIAKRIAEERGLFGDDLIALGAAAEIRLERCEARAQNAVETARGIRVLTDGHSCVMTVRFGDVPDYQVRGFFHHDGVDWAYDGPIRSHTLVEPDSFDRYPKGSTQTAKPGSVLYNGRAGGIHKANPYNRVLNGQNFFLEPTEQPYSIDLYSLGE